MGTSAKRLRETYGKPKKGGGYHAVNLLKDPVRMMVGISYDELQRMKPSRVQYVHTTHPLVDSITRRTDCLAWFTAMEYPTPPKSSCIGCPFHDDEFWRDMKMNEPEEFEDACQFDDQIRHALKRFKLMAPAFLHRSCRPLRDIDFRNMYDFGQTKMFEGSANMCGGHCMT